MPAKNINQPTDMEIALFLAAHLDNPCGIYIDGKWHDIRYFYKGLAQKLLASMTNPEAKEFLEKKISKEI
ncbi:MAG: hypothetical protein KJI71_03640 [Patescibacteria group bacterium]|nr:hypothetical protein [Patescibacteria group bacterium]